MDSDKAYLLGLIIGGGVFGNAEDVFRICLPYKKWGSYHDNPQRAEDIVCDILQKVSPMFRTIYNLSISYQTLPSGMWEILCDGDSSIVKNELESYGIVPEGEIRRHADIGNIVLDLVDDNAKRRFIAGLADTIGSMARSHRRFTDEHQILSFEIVGYNFKFVCDLCRLLYSVNCIPDQVNWNHPNIHCSHNPYYKDWDKGFKLRILLDQYAQFGAFAFRTKAEASIENRRLQQQAHMAERCEEQRMAVTPSVIHPAENDPRLPDEIRGGHYIHFRHFCTVLGCEHAPYDKMRECFDCIGELITPFPILCKDTLSRIEEIVGADELLAQREYATKRVRVTSLLEVYKRNRKSLMYGTADNNGYPIAEMLQGVAYIIADNDELFGKKPRGGYIQVIERHCRSNSGLRIEIRKPELLTPLIIVGNGRGALVGAKNPDVYSRLATFAPENEYKVLVRPITEEDLQNAGAQ